MNPVIKGQPIPPDVLAAWHAVNKITTEPVKYGDDGKGGQYTDAGSKHILINGVRWATIRMKGHGCHGPSYSIQNAMGTTLSREHRYKDGRDRERVSHHEITARTLKHDRTDLRSARQKMLDMIPDLVITGELRNPADLAAEYDADLRRVQEGQRKEREREELIRDTIRSLAKRPDLTNSEREGLSLAYEEIFSSKMEKDEK